MSSKTFSYFFILLVSFPSYGTTWETVKTHTSATLRDSVDSTGLWILGSGVAATVLAHQYDESTRNSWKDHQQMDPSVTKVGEFWGDGIPQVITFGSQLYFDPDHAVPGIEGILVGQFFVQTSKTLIGRERPNGRAKVSMPSGHTQSSFSLATSMTESYGIKKTWPFWAMAVFTGLTRISDDMHWLSDVTAGATIGILFGRAGFAHHQENVQPQVFFHEGRVDGGGLTLRWNWN